MIHVTEQKRIWLDFRSKITGSLDEAGDEAEASVLNCIKTLQPVKTKIFLRNSLVCFGN
jgi:hypothetical protein